MHHLLHTNHLYYLYKYISIAKKRHMYRIVDIDNETGNKEAIMHDIVFQYLNMSAATTIIMIIYNYRNTCCKLI